MFEIRWILDQPIHPPIAFLPGHIELQSDAATITSRDTPSPRRMMLVLSMVELLGKIPSLLTSIRVREYEFSNLEGWFQILFRKNRDESITVWSNGVPIHTGSIQEIHRTLLASVAKFLADYPADEFMCVAEHRDLVDAYQGFQSLVLNRKGAAMGMYGTIFIYPMAGAPPENLDAKALELIECFEKHELLSAGSASSSMEPQSWQGNYGSLLEHGEILPERLASRIINPERILPAMASLVNILTAEDVGLETEDSVPGQIELPFIKFTVIGKAVPIINGADGRELANTWAAIEFSYSDVRFDPEFHQILDADHPVFKDIEKVLGSPLGGDVFIG